MSANGWISVNERLPEPGIRVLVWVSSDRWGVWADSCVEIAERKNLYGKWDVEGWDHDDVTHWQPLPAPPEQQ